MILKASQRGGGSKLGRHLMNAEDNEHVEVHEVRGFLADDVNGAMIEAYALSRGTKCQQYLFSVSLSPPSKESVTTETFEQAIDSIESRVGLSGHARVIVFHEKEGRRHAHAVWSRIDPETMTAKRMSHFKTILRDIGRQLYLDNGWEMPDGFRDPRLRDPRNFTLAEWQQAKRGGVDPREVKTAIRDAWEASDGAKAFGAALEQRGLFLARGDRRSAVAVTMSGEVFSVARAVGEKTKAVNAKIGDTAALRSISDTNSYIAAAVAPRLLRYIAEAKRLGHQAMKPLADERTEMRDRHRAERDQLAARQTERHSSEQRERAGRLRNGVAGVWDILTGRYFKTRRRNEMEAEVGQVRDRAERHDLTTAQHDERQALQDRITATRSHHAEQILDLYRESARYREISKDRSAERSNLTTNRANTASSRGLDLG